MYKSCSHCNLNFEPEPGYYFGAMFISYTISALLLLPLGLLVVFKFDWSANQAMALIIFLGAVFYLKILRLSRSVWINMMTKYRPS